MLDDTDTSDCKEDVQSENETKLESVSLAEGLSGWLLHRNDASRIVNGKTSPMHLPLLLGSRKHAQRDDYSSEQQKSAEGDEDLDFQIRNGESQADVENLRFLLHQKELELSRLKELIEKEELALAILRSKAKREINEAQRLILEKDAELHAAEENLSGLQEVQIQFQGDGEIVEVAGSFNGWHGRIKLDPPSSETSAVEPSESRKSRLWTTVLWLYPGTYEIKFIVDGQWRIDPQRETVIRGHIQNNILQVGRR